MLCQNQVVRAQLHPKYINSAEVYQMFPCYQFALYLYSGPKAYVLLLAMAQDHNALSNFGCVVFFLV
jgi:hypothetical protein